jgi:CheY-like chemotaxis protein
VIALTAGAMESQRQMALAAGMNGFIAKPFRLKEMVATLTPWLRRDALPPERL